MTTDLDSLRIDKDKKPATGGSRWASRWIIGGVLLFLLLGAVRFIGPQLSKPPEVQTIKVVAADPAGVRVILNATGYIVAHHKIQLASKVVGKVAWIGVEKGDKVNQGQVIVKLEDDEYKAQLQQSQGQLSALEARLKELRNGSRPEEIAVAKANLDSARADLANAKINLDRTRKLVDEKVLSVQALDDANARYDMQEHRIRSLERTYELVRIGPRAEVIQQTQGDIIRARGAVALSETQLANTIIRAPIKGTILDRNVERGEFVTTGFVGDRGAKGFVVSMADLNDLQVELDINQNDFARLNSKQEAVITTDAYPDRKYEGVIDEIAPEANRAKATVQVKVKVVKPDSYLRPEMNASVAFIEQGKPADSTGKPLIFIPITAVRDGAVFVVQGGKAVRKEVKASSNTPMGLRIEDGLKGGEQLIANPAADLKDGAEVVAKAPASK
ncbi:MAG TPA: efflux RND transporter periplasmic adaptor subunit [Bryobacteraceae bacterium]|nr:efflux RND transporter periplasmic adaptor subunit [Bryobacteraceae bacterium]